MRLLVRVHSYIIIKTRLNCFERKNFLRIQRISGGVESGNIIYIKDVDID